MPGDNIPPAYVEIFSLTLATSEAYAGLLQKNFRQSGEAFERRTARFEIDTYLAFRAMCQLQICSAEYADIVPVLVAGVVGEHQHLVSCDDLVAAVKNRFRSYCGLWNASIKTAERPQLRCVRMLLAGVQQAATTGRVEIASPEDWRVARDVVVNFLETADTLSIDEALVERVDYMLKYVSDQCADLRSLSGDGFRAIFERGMGQEVARRRGKPANGPTTRPPKSWWRFWK